MKQYLKLLLPFTLLFISFTVCELKDRWKVRVLEDKESINIKWIPKNTTVKGLSNLIQPYPAQSDNKKDIIDKSVRFGYEFTIYQVFCKIKEFSKDSDGFYRLILVDLKDTTSTIFAEIPNPDCDYVKKNKYYKVYDSMRKEFENNISPEGKINSTIYTITGVCFFEDINGKSSAGISPVMDFVNSYRKY